MRLNNNRIYRNFVFLYIILGLLLAFELIISATSQGTMGQSDLHIWPFVLAIIVFLIYRGTPVFTYDSDGEVIILDSKEPSLMRFSGMFSGHYEFPKRKLVGYSFSRLPLRRTVTLKVASKDGKRKYVKASISYLNKHDVKDLERSLRGIISKNKKMGYIEDNA